MLLRRHKKYKLPQDSLGQVLPPNKLQKNLHFQELFVFGVGETVDLFQGTNTIPAFGEP